MKLPSRSTALPEDAPRSSSRCSDSPETFPALHANCLPSLMIRSINQSASTTDAQKPTKHHRRRRAPPPSLLLSKPSERAAALPPPSGHAGRCSRNLSPNTGPDLGPAPPPGPKKKKQELGFLLRRSSGTSRRFGGADTFRKVTGGARLHPHGWRDELRKGWSCSWNWLLLDEGQNVNEDFLEVWPRDRRRVKTAGTRWTRQGGAGGDAAQ